MTKKQCFKCSKLKNISEFYKHNEMSDGYLGKCKECTKNDVKKRYYSDEARDKIRAYEMIRSCTDHRREKRKIYQRNGRKRNPIKYKARTMVGNALRDKRLFREPCEKCGELKVEAHHEDYTKPLQVKWLCRKHHLEVEGKRQL